MAKTRAAAISPLYYAKALGALPSIVNASMYPGNVFYVDSGETTDGADTAGFGIHPDKPFLTLDFAVGQCTASQGDVIFVLPGHAETLATAAVLDIDVAGITIIGVGRGDARPTFSMSASASTVEINADDIHIENLIFVGTFTGGVAKAIDVKTGADDLTIKNCEFRETANTLELLIAINIEATINRVTIEGCRFKSVIGGDSTAAIFTEGACVDLRVIGCSFNGDWLNAVMDLDAAAITTPEVIRCHIRQADPTNGLAITIDSATIGHFAELYISTQKSNVVPISDLSASFCVEVYGTDAVATSAIILPATATAWS